AGKVLPAMDKLAPRILELTDAFGSAAVWASENAGKAVTIAITGSIARAGLENAFRGAIENILKSDKYDRGAGFGGGRGVVGNAAAAFTIASLAVTTATIGMAVIDKFWDDRNKAEGKRVGDEVAGHAAANHVLHAQPGDLSGDYVSKAKDDL